MKDRFKQVRKELKLTQVELANQLGVQQATITAYETGNRDITDRTVKALCEKYKVNETWLRTGEGEMFQPRPRTEVIAAFMTDLLLEEEDSYRRRLIEAMAYWTEEDWEDMARLAKKLALNTTQDEKKG
jgi:transcriptional regulator with XRE-family HTH domain